MTWPYYKASIKASRKADRLHSIGFFISCVKGVRSKILSAPPLHNICDGTFFQEYENEQNLKLWPSDRMLAEIEVKNFLLQLSKRTQEAELYKKLQGQFVAYNNPEELARIISLDIRDFNGELQYHKWIVDNDLNGGYQILFWKLLTYKVPIAPWQPLH